MAPCVQAGPTSINGAPFILVASNPSGIELCVLTSDAQGRVYAGNNSNGDPGIPVQRFDPASFSGVPVAFQDFGPACPDADGLTFGNGSIFVANMDAGVLAVAASGTSSVFVAGVAENGTGSPLVYRPADGHLFVGLGGLTGILRIDEYSNTGAFVRSHATGTDVETMTFDAQSGLIYYAAFGSAIRALDPNTDADRLVANVDGTIDGALAFDPISQRLFVGTANGSNPGLVETVEVSTGTVSPFASGFSHALGVLREPVSGNLYFLDFNKLYMLSKTNVNQAIPPIGLAISLSNSIARTTWQVVSGNSYQLQVTPRLVPSTWSNVGPILIAVSNRLDLLDTSATNSPRFYRAVLLP
jgi:hypothetical protein